ncbi:MAG: T9SS type A sorting domain-containing protein [Bacteroidota bacterium]
MKYLSLITTILVLLLSASIHAQSFLPELGNEPLKMKDLELSFKEWSKQNELESSKGWKWYARWLEEQAIRTDAEGNLGNQAPLFQSAVQKMAVEKNTIAKRSPNWIPAGPNDYARIVTSYIIRGMGRINCITFHPTDANTFWVGVAQGGIWKTTNGGETWMPLDNGLPILRISDIAINPNNADEMYVSVGDYAYLGISLELDDRKRHTHYGMGVYKSTNGGQSWEATGLTFEQENEDATLTRRVFVDPDNGQKLLAGGIFGIKTSEDGGGTWQTVNEEVVRDIEQDPINPNILYAATATIRNLERGQSAIWKSTDFGRSWTRLNTQMPENNTIYRVELAISRSNPDYVYALTVNDRGGLYGLYQSTDAGETWEMRSNSPNILHWSDGSSSGGQGSYDLTILVDPNDPEKIYTGGINLWGSDNGGTNWSIVSYWVGNPDRKSIHADQHFLAYNPLDQKFYACNDGGVSRANKIELAAPTALNNLFGYPFETDWEDIAGGMQITSFYRIGLSKQQPGEFIAGTQDNSSWIKKDGEWTGVIGGDGMEGLFNPDNEQIIYGSSQFGNISKSVDGGNNFFNISRNIPANNERGAWTTPFMLDKNDSETLYVGYSNLYKSKDGGENFEAISDFPVPSAQPASIFTVSPADNNYIYLAHRIVHSIEEPSRMWRTFDGGETWTEITSGLPQELYFTYVAADESNPELLWLTLGGFSDGQKVYRSDDGGDTWENISYNLPNVPVNCITQDPNSPSNTIYIGTDLGVYYLNDNLDAWELYSKGLPNVIVSELEILDSENKIYAATFGRGIWEGDLVFEESVNTDEEFTATFNATVSPSPNDGQFSLQLENLPNAKQLNIKFVDIKGRVLLQQERAINLNDLSLDFDLDLPFGLYFMRLESGKRSKVVRFVVE